MAADPPLAALAVPTPPAAGGAPWKVARDVR